MRVGIIDDHQIFRDGLKRLLPENEFKITLEAFNGIDMINQLKGLSKTKLPEIFIIDINMPIMDGFETVSWLRSKYPKINIIVLTMREDEDSVLRMIKLGVKSYLTKDIGAGILINALKIVYNEKLYFPDSITSIIVNGYKRDDIGENSIPKRGELSEREKQFLILACTEKNYQEIAKEMNISPRAVDAIRDTLFKKLKVGNRVGLALFAIKIKLVSI